jgi:hypothetical protein
MVEVERLILKPRPETNFGLDMETGTGGLPIWLGSSDKIRQSNRLSDISESHDALAEQNILLSSSGATIPQAPQKVSLFLSSLHLLAKSLGVLMRPRKKFPWN